MWPAGGFRFYIYFNKDFQDKLVKYFSSDHFVTSECPAHNFLHFLHYLESIGLPLWIVICISVCIIIHRDKIWRLLKHFFSSLHFIAYYDKSWGTRGALSWCIMINYDISQSSTGKSFRVSWKIMICHDLHNNISER